jgi:hypothetical protein
MEWLIELFEKGSKVHTGITVMALIEQVVALAVKVSSGLARFGGRVSANHAPTIPQLTTLGAKARET